jgi:hypothetical protein
MADFFGHSQFGGHYFKGPEQGAPAPSFNPGFETIVPGQVVFSMGARKPKGHSAAANSVSGGVVYSSGLGKKK